jgi:hypothetical protein
MASHQQIEANRQNAQASTGPKSPAGKQTVSRNALRHGLTATSIDQFPPHIREAFLDFREELLHDFHPSTTHEFLLFETMAFARFLLLRAAALHAGALEAALTQPGDPAVLSQLTRVQRYLRGLERSASQATAAFQQAYADRAASVDIQEIITNEFHSPAVLPSAAPIARIVSSDALRVPPKEAALRLAFIEQRRLRALDAVSPFTSPAEELMHHE